MNSQRKTISMFVIVSFTVLLCVWTNLGAGTEKNSRTTMEQSDGSTPNFLEQEKNGETVAKKGKKFPWLMAGLGAVALGVVIYFLVIKKSRYCTLTIDRGEGTTGEPASTVKVKKQAGFFINYQYVLQAGYHGLQVKLDGIEAPDHGTITMNRDHTLSVTATKAVVSYGNGVLIVDDVSYELAAIPAGTFRMGGSRPEESPVHTVRISKGFSMLKTEVTQGLWQAVMSSNPSRNKSGADYPVENVTWADCQGFIQQLNMMLGGNAFRLPTEAEWEYSCRAGTTGERYGDLDAISWNVYNSGGAAHPVGLKQPNSWGLYDMLGNIQEWCQDWYGPYSGGDQTDPAGPSSGYGRALRGSTFQNGPVRSAGRWGSEPIVHDYTIGFRLARTDD
jgi:sulfatase modifying factor 1